MFTKVWETECIISYDKRWGRNGFFCLYPKEPPSTRGKGGRRDALAALLYKKQFSAWQPFSFAAGFNQKKDSWNWHAKMHSVQCVPEQTVNTRDYTFKEIPWHSRLKQILSLCWFLACFVQPFNLWVFLIEKHQDRAMDEHFGNL